MGLIDVLKEKMVPTDALIFYSCDSGKYVEHRRIANGRMCAGQPLDARQFADMISIAEKYASGQQDMGFIHGAIPMNMLYADPSIDHMRLVWYRKPEERKMYFSDGLAIPEGTMKVPGMIYSVRGNDLYVYCFKGARPNGVLYRAPFFNIYSEGRVCLGNSKTEKPKMNTFEEWMLYWEKMFWQSEFADLISDNPIEGNLATVTKNCIRKGRPFPVELMKRHEKKLNDLLR